MDIVEGEASIQLQQPHAKSVACQYLSKEQVKEIVDAHMTAEYFDGDEVEETETREVPDDTEPSSLYDDIFNV
jgi:hypothetical protein